MDPKFQLVLLCADEDDLELVSLVHHARERGIELQVVPGVESYDDAMVQAFRRFKHALFILLASPHLPQSRTFEGMQMFELGRQPGQHIAVCQLRPDEPEVMLAAIEQQFRAIAGIDLATHFRRVQGLAPSRD